MATSEKTSLFEPTRINGYELKNRIVMAPMTRSRAIGNQVNELMVTYYAQRASAGLIITEGVSPSLNGIGYARTPGIYSKEQIDGWKKVTEAVHDKGGKIFIQLMHVGRIAHSVNQQTGARIIGPSQIKASGQMWTDSIGMQSFPIPEEMKLEDIANTVQEFKKAAQNAIEAGFDGVELHGANGYLLEQFLNPNVNQRKDEYGGSVEKRTRFITELTDEVIEAIGKDKVGIRLSPYSQFNDMSSYENVLDTYDYLTQELNKRAIAYIHLVDYASVGHSEGRSMLKKIRENFSNSIIRNGGYNKERAEDIISNGEADLISFGAPFIPNPDLVRRMKENIPLSTPLSEYFYTPGEKGYIDYSFAVN